MRMKLLLLLLLFFIPLNAHAVGEQPLLKDKLDQLNYSLGYQLGQQIKTENLEFVPEPLWLSLNEGLSGTEGKKSQSPLSQLGYALGQEIATKSLESRTQALWQGLYDQIDRVEPRVLDAEMAQLLAEFRGLPASTPTDRPLAKKAPPVPVKSLEPPPKYYRLPGEKFLDENKDDQNVVTLANGLQYRILATGTGKSPKATDRVLVNYLGKTIDGRVFSTSGTGGIQNPEEVVVNKVVPGVTQALQMMHEGDKWELVIPSRLAFKDASPLAGQTIIFELELLEILPEFY